MPIPPLVLSVVTCDVAHRDRETGKWFIIGSFNRLGFPELPSVLATMQVFLSLIEVNGVYDFRARIIDVNEDREPIHQAHGELVGTDPLATFEFSLTFTDVPFPEAGEYRLQILIDGEVIAERKLVVYETHGDSHDV